MSTHVFLCIVALLKPSKASQPGNLQESVPIMLALLRIFKNLRDREHYLRTRYHKDHPHFLLYLALDAILTVTFVGGGLALASAGGAFERDPEVLVDLGLAPVTETKLRAQAAEHGVKMYWVGPSPATKYTSEVLNLTAVTLGYVADATTSGEIPKPYISVKTYNDPLNYLYGTRGPLRETPDEVAKNSLGNEITYNVSDLRAVSVNLADVEKVVVITFATPQTVGELIEASENLYPVL